MSFSSKLKLVLDTLNYVEQHLDWQNEKHENKSII